MPSELLEALTAASVAPLIQKQIDRTLLEYMRRYAPLLRGLPSKKWGSTQYFFNLRTQLPSGGFVQDGGARPVTNSTYAQQQFTIRNLQSVGAVTGYAQVVTADLVGDLQRQEIDGAMTGLMWDVETGIDWGSSAATTGGALLSPYPQFDGLDTLVSNFSAGSGINAFVNSLDSAGAGLTLALADEIIDLVESNAAMPVQNSQWCWVCSPRMQSKFAQLITNQQRFVDKVDVDAGLNVMTYRDIPFLKSSFLSARSNQMGTVTTTTATTGGTIPDATTYYYKVSAVIARFGEIQASAEVSRITGSSGSNTNTIVLHFSTPTSPDGQGPILYKVYRSSTTNTETLLGIVDAFDTTSVTSPNPTVTITDTGTGLLPNGDTNATPTYAGGNAGVGAPPASSENIYLIPRDENFLTRPYTRDFEFLRLAATTSAPDTLPFAIVSDTALAVRGPKYVGRAARVLANI